MAQISPLLLLLLLVNPSNSLDRTRLVSESACASEDNFNTSVCSHDAWNDTLGSSSSPSSSPLPRRNCRNALRQILLVVMMARNSLQDL
eukprot:759513-Hanusia_phi.AAC.11